MEALDLDAEYDAVIIGARCAGAATALLLARSGAKVLLIDRQAEGLDTISTHALMRGAIIQLKRWDLAQDLLDAGSPEIRTTTFHYGGETVRIEIKPEHGVDYLLAPRRTILDPLLVDAARRAGATVCHGIALSELQFAPSSGRVIGVTLRDPNGVRISVRSGIVVGADGRNSTVAQSVNAQSYFEGQYFSGLVYGYFEGLSATGLHWHFAKNAAAGVVPTNASHCVFAAVPGPCFAARFRGNVHQGFLQVLEANDRGLRAEVSQAKLIGRLRGFAGAKAHLRQCQGAGWALVGDAGYFKDPLTAHGITDALRDAQLLSTAIMAGGSRALGRYQEERDALSMPFLRVTEEIASFSWDLHEVKQLHSSMSSVMRTEANHIAQLSTAPSLAA
jgi:2-polyprenyl-6-methoxyphenol hydroxylase-like FAD-dependent oxidoreductase